MASIDFNDTRHYFYKVKYKTKSGKVSEYIQTIKVALDKDGKVVRALPNKPIL